MNENISSLKQRWDGLNTYVKWIIPTLLISGLIIALIYMFKPSDYEELYSGLSNSDSVEIQQYLSKNAIEYNVGNEGATISIIGNVPMVRKDLSVLNLPSNPEQTGLAEFSEINIGSTKFDKEIQYQDRLQTDLALDLVQGFDIIDQAMVSLPKVEKKSPYQDENTETKISVAIRPTNGSEITPENVKAIQLYLASSIHDVVPENVEVVDSKLNVLSGSPEDSDAYGVSKSMEITNRVKAQIEDDLLKTMKDVYGNVNVIANVDIDFDEIVQNIETYAPQGTVVSREQLEDREASVEGAEGEVVGTDENGEVPGYEIENLDAEDSDYLKEKQHLIENFSVGKTVEQVIRHPELRNVNVAVWVDSELDQEDIERLETMVAISSGLTGNAERDEDGKLVYDNGSVMVEQVAFVGGNEDIFEEEVVEDEKSGIPWWIYAIAAAVILILIIIIVLILVRRSRKQDTDSEEAFVEEEEETTEEPVEELVQVEEEQAVEEAAVDENEEKFNFEWTNEQKSMRELTNEVTKKFPKETADVIRKLLKK